MKKKLLRGFTLIELLVVITIIGILASLAIPTINGVLNAAKKTEARVFMSSLQTAIVNYQTEYNTYPEFITTLGATDAKVASAGDWTDFYDVFVYPDRSGRPPNKGNSRNIQFLTVQSKYLNAPDTPTSANYFKDPWGKLYSLWVDTDYNTIIKGLPNIKTPAGPAVDIAGNVAVFSAANDDGLTNTKSIGTWK